MKLLTILKKIIFVKIIFLSACSSYENNADSKPFFHIVDKLAQGLTADIKENVIMPEKSPILVMTPVFVDEIEKSNHFARVLQQTLISELYKKGFYVSELNLSKYVKVTKSGDFVLTRDWSKISKELDINYLLISTIGVSDRGYILNSRIVYLDNHQVLAAANTFIPQNYIAEFLPSINKVQIHNGMLYRESSININ